MSSQSIRNILNTQIDNVLQQAKAEVKKQGKQKVEELKKKIPTPQTLMEKLKTEKQNGEFKEAPKVKDTEIPSSTDTTEVMAKEKNTSNTFLLSAEKSETGYYLLNSNNELVFDLLNTSTKDVFIVKNKNGVLTKKGNQWIFEHYEDKLFIKKVLQIKF